MKKNINEILTTKKQKFIVGVTVMLLLIAVGMFSYAFTGDISYFGLNTNKFSNCGIDVSFKDSNPIRLTASYPMSYETAKEFEPYTFYVKNKAAGCNDLIYKIKMVNTCDTCATDSCDLEDGNSCNCSEGYQIEESLINYELKNVTTGKITTGTIDKLNLDVSLGDYQTHTYEMRIWINENATNSDVYVDGDNKKTKGYCGKLNVRLSYDVPVEANAPELATNMIPVTYDSEHDTWVKADSTNKDNSWYNYNNKIWANAVTVTSTNRDTYVKATPGTPIAMDDINTMWVWIPRFNASKGGLCSSLENPTVTDYPNCYEQGEVDITDENLEEMKTVLYMVISAQSSSITYDQVSQMADDTLAGDDEQMKQEMIYMYGQGLMIQHFSSYITLSQDDRTLINNFMGSEANAQFYLDNGAAFYILNMLSQNGQTITSDITIPNDDEAVKYMCKTNGMTDEECNAQVASINSSDNATKLNALNNFSNDETLLMYFATKAADIVYDLKFVEDKIYAEYNGTGDVSNPGAFNIKFVTNESTAHDAFTFGDEELNGIWVAKFEPSHPTLSEDTTNDSLECTNDTCENAKGIEILPNKVSLRYQNVSNFFYAGRSLEQTGNNYGFVSNEIDTHMMKNSEWGAVAYLTQSVYGRCTSSTSCTEVGINNNSSFITGYGAPAGSDTSVANGTYETALGMGASTTGNIYGVYDMSGGASEYVMGVYTDGTNLWSGEDLTYNSGFNGCVEDCSSKLETGLDFPDTKYYNTYTTSEAYTNAGLQHAVSETSGWYSDYYAFINQIPWVVRGGGFFSGGLAGVFAAGNNDGYGDESGSFRPVLVK